MKNSFAFGLFFIATISAARADPNACLETLHHRFVTAESAALTLNDPIQVGNGSVILEGHRTDEVVILVHGYIASPFEVRALGEKLQRRGMTVVMPLLPGFGRSTRAANTATAEEWTAEVRELFLELARCYPKVSLAGFSLGGNVVTDLAINDPAILTSLGTLTLISPALRLKNRALLDLLLPFRFIFGNRMSIPRINRLAMKIGNGDLNTPNDHPEVYNSELPLRAVHELRRLGRKVRFSDFARLQSKKVTFIFSDFDKTVNADLAWRKANRARPMIEKFEIQKEDRVPHQVLVPDGNACFDDVLEFTANAILDSKPVTYPNL